MANRIVGYFENWAQYRQSGGKFMPSQVNPGQFTHINFAFGLFGFVTWSVDPTEARAGPQRYTGDYTIQPVEGNDQTVLYPALQALKQQNGALKTLLSIGGWSMNSGDDMPNSGNPHPYGPYTYQLFSKMAVDPRGRTQFIGSAIDYAQKYGFDGIDIDWEYPGYISRGGDPNDLANFLALVQEFRATAGPGFLLTMAAPAIVPTGLPQTYHDNPSTFFQWLQQCSQSLDWLNIMSYDYHGAFDDPVKTGTGVNSPLAQDSTAHGPFSVKQTVEAYLAAGIPSDKMVLGMPTYGRNFTVSNPGQLAYDHSYGKPFNGAGPAGAATQVPGVLAYYEIIQKVKSGELVEQWDDATLTPYAYSATTGEWVSYDNPRSLGYKTAYANARGLGGAMVWSVDDDDFPNGSPLLTQVKTIVDNPQQGPQLPGSLLAPSDLRRWAEQRADVARRWAESERDRHPGVWDPIPSQPSQPTDTRARVDVAADAVRRLCEGYGDALRRRGEAWHLVIVPKPAPHPAPGQDFTPSPTTGRDVQKSFAQVIGFWEGDVGFTQQNVDMSTEVESNPQDVLLQLKQGLSDAQLRLTEGGASVDFSSLLVQYHNQKGLRLAGGYADGFRRISEGWKDALLRLKERNLQTPDINQLATDCVKFLFSRFITIVSAPQK